MFSKGVTNNEEVLLEIENDQLFLKSLYSNLFKCSKFV